MVNLSLKISVRNVVPVFSNRYDLVRSLIKEYYEARQLLRKFASHIIVCELTGLHYGTYNVNSGRTFPEEQNELNAGIILLHDYIRVMNNEEGIYSPHILEYTHKQRKEKDNLVHRYSASKYD